MLPSTGYFKSINCPFYDNSVCDRPYCHFKHLRREDASTAPTVSTQATEGYKNSETTTTTTTAITPATTTVSTIPQTKSEIIQQLVTEAVTKVLVDQGVSDTDKVSENIVSKVVEGLKPSLSTTNTIGKHSGVPQSITKPPCIYNPTPISELKKRHNLAIPFYNPTTVVRDCKTPAIKRKSSDEFLSWSANTVESANELTYKPTAISYDSNSTVIHDYIPTVKLTDSNLLNLYDDSNSSGGDYGKRKETYCPKVKKRREEYVPKKIKTPLQSVPQYDDDDDMIVDEYNNDFNLFESNSIVDCKNNISEGKFSDDDDDDDDDKKDSEMTTKEVQKTIKTVDDKTIVSNKNKDNDKLKIIKKDVTSRRNSTNSDTHSKKKDDGEKKKLDKENSKNHSDKSKKEHSSKTDNDDGNKKNNHSRDHKHSSDKHKSLSSSSSRHSSHSKSSHRDKETSSSSSSSSSHRNKDKSHSSRHKKSSSKENEHDKSSSKNNKHKSSSSSSKSDKSSSSRSSDSKKSTSSRDKKSSNKNSDKQNKNHHHAAGEDRLSNDDDFESSFGDFTELLETSDSEHDVEEECLKIFQEYQESDHPRDGGGKKSSSKNHQAEEENEAIEEVGKKRVAHPSAGTCSIRNPGPSQPLKKLQNPQQKMYERWRLMKEAAVEKASVRNASSNNQEQSENDIFNSTKSQQVVGKAKIESKSIHVEPQVNGNARLRIAHVPYAMSLALTKKKVTESAPKPVEPKTVAQTTKGGPRVAHVPQVVPQLIRPEPLQVAAQKFHLNVRQYYVNLMQDICVQIYTNGDDAAQRALREELACHERCKALSVYKNSCMLAAHRLRKEVDPSSSDSHTGPSASGMVSHDAVLAGRGKGTWSVVKTKKAITNFKGSAFYLMLKKWIMSEQQLRDWGFPRLHPDGPKGRAKVYTITTRNQSIVSKVPNERYCLRCNQPYMVDKYSMAVQQQNCIYHWGRKYTVRGEGKYSCCQQYGSASGCCDAKNHVWDIVDYENLRGYVQTLPKDTPPEDQGVYALDCEMCYTSQGLELTRITVINEDCNVIYESLVKPDNPIIDYNTRFSGITEENLTDVTTTLRDVQATLLTMFSEHTILVGHSLDSDFKALKLIHNTIVDTSNMFPHKNGFPQKRALRNLCSDFLRKIIQSDINGHDSKEDAVACMELIQWKVKEEAKLQ